MKQQGTTARRGSCSSYQSEIIQVLKRHVVEHLEAKAPFCLCARGSISFMWPRMELPALSAWDVRITVQVV